MTAWNIDSSRSSVSFTVRHLVFTKVRGKFPKWTASLSYDAQHPAAAKVEARIDLASVDTGQADRDENLRSAGFFDAATFPEMWFRSTSVEPLRAGRFVLRGDLTIRGTTRPVALDVEAIGRGKESSSSQRAGFRARGRIDRTDFGLKWSPAIEAGGVTVGRDIDLEIELQALAAME